MNTVTMTHAIPRLSIILVGASRPFDYVDSFSTSLRLAEPLSIDYLTAKTFAVTPGWVHRLMQLRDAIVAPLGLKTSDGRPPLEASRELHLEPGKRAGLFNVSHRDHEEIVMAEQDRHLDCRVSVRASPRVGERVCLEVTTAVWFNNAWGRLYFGLIKPFHRVIVRQMLKSAAARLEAETGIRGTPHASASTFRQRLAALIALAGGLLVTWMGVAHFPMAYAVANSPPFMLLTPSARDWPILLCLCVGLLLIFVGALSVYFARRLSKGERGARLFFASVGSLLLARTALELLHPVTVVAGATNVFGSLLLTTLILFAPVLIAGGRAPSSSCTP